MLGFEALGRLALGEMPLSGQSLAANLYSNTQTFYPATIVSVVPLAPALYSNAQIFYQPTVVLTAGPDQAVLPPFFYKQLSVATVIRL